MVNNFEEALHQGYSAADMVADIKENEERCMQLGCGECKYRYHNSPTCDMIFRESAIYARCPYFRKEEE